MKKTRNPLLYASKNVLEKTTVTAFEQIFLRNSRFCSAEKYLLKKHDYDSWISFKNL